MRKLDDALNIETDSMISNQEGNKQPPNLSLLDAANSLSQSIVWKLGGNYYESEGPQAWGQGKIPFFITHHQSLVDYYADVIERLIDSEKEGSSEAIYIVEIGAGRGHFAWKLLSTLERRISSGLSRDLLQYEMTDFAESNLQFALNHPQLQPFLERQVLKVSKFAVGTDTAQRFGKHKKLVVIANYTIDSTPHDIFYISDNELFVCRPTIYVPVSPETKTEVGEPDSLHLLYEKELTTYHYYNEPEIDKVLRVLCQRSGEGFLAFPIAQLRFLSELRTANQQVILLASDLPGPVWDSAASQQLPSLYWRGGIWLQVNFDTIKTWFENQNGNFKTVSVYYGSLATVVGITDDNIHASTPRITDYESMITPPDSWLIIYNQFYRHIEELSKQEILAWLRSCSQNPSMMRTGLEQLRLRVAEMTPDECHELELIATIALEYHFYVPREWDLAASFAELFLHLGLFQAAARFWQYSIKNELNIENCFGYALTAAQLADYALARTLIDEGLKLKPEHEPSRLLLDWLQDNVDSK